MMIVNDSCMVEITTNGDDIAFTTMTVEAVAALLLQVGFRREIKIKK